MTTAQFFVYKRPVAWTALVATLLWGVYAYFQMPQRHDPRIPVRIGTVVTVYPGAEAEKVEQEVTRKIEQRLSDRIELCDRIVHASGMLISLGKCAAQGWVVRTFNAQTFDKGHCLCGLTAGLQIGEVVFDLGAGLGGLSHFQAEVDEVVAGAFIFRMQRADLFVDADGLFPIQPLHVDICHAAQDVHVPFAVGVGLLYNA